jgi:hypothetical protein
MLRFADKLAKEQMQVTLKALKNAPPELSKKLKESLVNKLRYLSNYACYVDDKLQRDQTICMLFKDFEPYSFIFTMKRKNASGGYDDWFSGGLIFHDDMCGRSSVVLENVHGWSVHT